MSYSRAVNTPDLMTSASSSGSFINPGTPLETTLPEFVRSFASEDDDMTLNRDSLRNMFHTLEKAELIEMLTMSVMQSTQVRSSVGYALSNMTTFRRLLVRNIAFTSTSEEVRSLLSSRYGMIEEGSVVYDRSTGKSKGFAFMTFATVESACNAILDSNNGLIELVGRQLLLKFAADRNDAINTGTKISSETASSVASVKRLFVSGLATETCTQSLMLAMSAFGEMDECFVVSGPNGQSRRFGFVTFASEDSAWACMQQPLTVDGTYVSVQYAAEKAPTLPPVKQRSAPALAPKTGEPALPNMDELFMNLLTGLGPIDNNNLEALWTSSQ